MLQEAVRALKFLYDVDTFYTDLQNNFQLSTISITPSIKWKLPKKFPKYIPDDAPIGLNEISLFTVMPKTSIFVHGHPKGNGLTEKRIEELLIQILESMSKEESVIFEQMLKKNLKVKGLTEKLVLEVFPDLYRKV